MAVHEIDDKLSVLVDERRVNGSQPRARARERRDADERDLERAVTARRLPPAATQYLGYRVLPFARFCEKQANSSRLTYYWLRIPAITLAAVIPALVAANLGSGARWAATGLGVIVAATTGTEHFLNVGARWRHYRGAVETLKSETWSFLERAGNYASCKSYKVALDQFVRETERLICQEWTQYVSLINSDDGASSRRAGAQHQKTTP